MKRHLIAIIGLASALALSQHANATAPPAQETAKATRLTKVAMQPKDTLPNVDYQSTAATFAVASFQEQLLEHRDPVATPAPTATLADPNIPARVAQEVDAHEDAVT